MDFIDYFMLVVGIGFAWFLVFTWRDSRRENVERARAQETARAAVIAEMQKHEVVVCIREKDGRKSFFESVVIQALLESGATVWSVSEEISRQISAGIAVQQINGRPVICGTGWTKTSRVAGQHIEDISSGPYYMPEHDSTSIHCDYRILHSDGNALKILGAGYSNSGDAATLAQSVVEAAATALAT